MFGHLSFGSKSCTWSSFCRTEWVQLAHGSWVLSQLGNGVPIQFCKGAGSGCDSHSCGSQWDYWNIIGCRSTCATGLNICPAYRAIRHTLLGPQSMVQWTKHSGKRYFQSLPYAHMLGKARFGSKWWWTVWYLGYITRTSPGTECVTHRVEHWGYVVIGNEEGPGP